MLKYFSFYSFMIAFGVLFSALTVPVGAHAQPFTPPTGLVSDLFSGFGDGQKEDLELKDAINYDACFDYSEGMSITLSPKCMFSKMPPIPAPVFRYKAEHTEPTVIVELTMDPGGGALKKESSLGNIMGQGALGAVAGGIATGDVGGALAGGAIGALSGSRTKGSPTSISTKSGMTRKAYFDGHVWGVGPLGLLDAGKGGVEEQGGGRMNALKSMICWLADASEFWTPVPMKASAHLAVISPAADPYLRYYLGDWGTKWYNKAGSAQVSATTASSFASGFGDNAAYGLAALGAVVGYGMASGDGDEKCRAKASTERAKQQAGGVRESAEANEDELQELAPKATYLPAGYDQVSTGYDTCPLTGVGHYVDEETGQIGFNNCDPQERIIRLNCGTGQGQFVSSAPGPVTTTMNPYQNPCAGNFQTFADDNYAYVRAPSCHNRLSGFKQDGKYLACNSGSTTFASCGGSLSGSGKMVPGHGSGAAGNQSGSFSLCLKPSGTKTVNHLDEYNQSLASGMTQVADDYARGVEAADEAMGQHLEDNEVVCKSDGGNGVMGAAIGAGVGYAAGKGIEALSGQGGDLTGKAGEYFGDVKGKISGAIKGSELGEGFSKAAEGMQENFDKIKGNIQGKISDVTQGAGLGSLSNAASKAGAIAAFDGSLGSMSNIAETMGVMPEWLNTAVSMFNQEKIIPLFISEQHQNDWRSENPATKMARMSLMGNAALSGSFNKIYDNLADYNCGKVGVWGQLCPLRGFTEISTRFQASGLAGWRAYHKALPKIPDRKRMKDKATVFNLDYPHQSSCHEIGVNPSKWESRSEQGGGIIGRLFGGAASGLSNIFNAGNPDAGLGSMFGSPSDKRLETGAFVYTYWKDTKCTWDVCTSPNSGLSLSDLANVPGLEALQNVSSKLDALKSNLPGMETLQGLPGVEALKGLPGANKIGGFAGDWVKGKVPGGDFIWQDKGGEESAGDSGGGECLGPVVNCDEGGGSPYVPDYLGGSAASTLDPPDTLNGSFSALKSIPGAEGLNNMISGMSPANIPSLGNLGKIIKFDNKK